MVSSTILDNILDNANDIILDNILDNADNILDNADTG